MSRLIDGGFETPGPELWGNGGPWVLSGIRPYGYSAARYHSGRSSCLLHSFGQTTDDNVFEAIDSEASQSVATAISESIVLAGWVYPALYTPDSRLQLLASGTVIDSIDPSTLLQDAWSPHIWPPFTAHALSTSLALRLTAPASFGASEVFLDDLQIVGGDDMAKRSRWLAHQRLVQVLKNINGIGYYTDLGGRVFLKYVAPQGGSAPPFPYLCVPLVNTAPTVEHDATWIRHTWTLPIMLFVKETNVGAYDSDAIAAIYHLTEDIYHTVMQDETLNNTVDTVTFVSGGIEQAGLSAMDGLLFADAVVPLKVSIKLGLDVIGP